MNKKLSLTIGEKEVTLNFGANWFFEFYKEDSGHDLVKDPNLQLLDLTSVQLFSYLQSMIWAGYQAECAVSKKELEISRDDVKAHVMDGTEAEASSLAWKIVACANGIAEEELREAARKAAEEKKSL